MSEAGNAPDLRLESTLILLEEVRAGNSVAQNVICERYLARLQRWAKGRLPAYARDLMHTEDLVQETLLKALHHMNGFEYLKEGGFQSYLRQAVLNRIRDEIRRAKRRPAPTETASGLPARGASPLEDAIGKEAFQRYESALSRLSDGDRECIIARVELGFDYQHIARELGKSGPDAARMAVKRALVRLAEGMRRP